MAWIFVLVVVVFIHELGHFLVARWCGVNVSAFSIGFGREIVGYTDKKGTRWKLGWLPLGGYVKFMDDENGASVPSHEKLAKMTEAERAGAFHAKPLWQRAAVVAAGPMANFLSAIVIFAAVGMISGTVVVPPEIALVTQGAGEKSGFKDGDIPVSVDGVPVANVAAFEAAIARAKKRELAVEVLRDGTPQKLTARPERKCARLPSGQPTDTASLAVTFNPVNDRQLLLIKPQTAAMAAGLVTGDLVLRVDGRAISSFNELSQIIAEAPGKKLAFDIRRSGSELTLPVTPRQQTVCDGFGSTDTRGIIGIRPNANPQALPVTFPGPLEALRNGVEQTYLVASTTLGYMRDVVLGLKPLDKLGGLPTIIDVSNQVATFGWVPLFQIIGLLSVSIGLLNLFPIPLLDGGHLMYYAAEAVRGRPLSDQMQEFGFRIGLALVSMLMVVALWNDRFRMLAWVNDAVARVLGILS
jgi:regulator of sigma E protease